MTAIIIATPDRLQNLILFAAVAGVILAIAHGWAARLGEPYEMEEEEAS